MAFLMALVKIVVVLGFTVLGFMCGGVLSIPIGGDCIQIQNLFAAVFAIVFGVVGFLAVNDNG